MTPLCHLSSITWVSFIICVIYTTIWIDGCSLNLGTVSSIAIKTSLKGFYASKGIGCFQNLKIFWEEYFGWNFLGGIFGRNFLEECFVRNWNFLVGILWQEFCGNCQWFFTFLNVNWFLTFSNSADCLNFQSQLIIYFVKFIWFFLYSKSQLITKSYLNMEGIRLFIKVLFFCQYFVSRKENKIT